MASRVAGQLVLAALVMASAACGASESNDHAADDAELRVVTTVAPLTSIVASIAGDDAVITGIVPEGTNSHTFEPAPSVAKVLNGADVIFVNGLQLEDPTLQLAERNKRRGARLVKLGDAVLSPAEYKFDFSFPKEHGKPNPHLWTDPTFVRRYAEVVRDTLSEAAPSRRDGFVRNFRAFAGKVDELDAAMRASFDTIPRERRKLLTYHDAYAYFADSYGWSVIGAIQVESFQEPTPREVARLIDQVRAEKVPAIFGSEVFPSPVLAQIGREAGVRYIDVLRDDDLPGRPGEPRHSWLGLMQFDFVTMVEALGGDASALKAVEVEHAVPDTARYPQ